jgi:nitroimidazol reductase NimA-like FMN-containing flavoprotein (pyridoxamine 5'-phosphate oxidase superfamily)
VTVLSTAGDAPHAIPVSAALRAGDDEILLGLGARRTSLARIRADPRVAVTVLGFRNLAFTAHGTATVVSEDAAGVVAVHVAVESIQDHFKDDFKIEAGVDWHWTDPAAAERDGAVRAALRALSGP